MALKLRASVSSRCYSKSLGQPARMVSTRAACTKQEPHLALANIALSGAAAAVLLSITAPMALAADAAPTEGAPAAPTQTTQTSTATSISFARVDMAVTQKLRQRDENLAWKCKGVNMYDCDGELAEAAEKRFDEMANIFRSSSQ